jgi:F-type H+-transporting ATPase subunit b
MKFKIKNSKLKFFLLAWALSIATPLLSFGSEGGHEEASLNVLHQVVFPYINFILLIGLLVYLLKRPAQDFFLARSKKIAQEIEKAAHEKNEAEAGYLNYERRLKNIETEVEEFVAALKKEGELARNKIIEEAHLSSQRLQETARRIAELETLKVRENLREKAVDLSVEWTEKLIRENLTSADRERMVKDYLKRLEGHA